jgi:hypothetical protein
MHDHFAILVTSCDKYSDLWEGFFSQLDKNLSVPVKKYLLTNHQRYVGQHISQVQTILVGDDLNWSHSLSRALDQIPEVKLFIIVEDFFITVPIDSDLMERVISFSKLEDAQLIHYDKLPGSVPSEFSEYNTCEPGMPYLTGVCGIWDREYLKSLLIEGESPWQFEVYGSYRAQFSANKIYCLKTPLFKFNNMIQKGAWVKSNISWAKKNNILLDYQKRPIQGSTLFYFKDFYFQMMLHCPWRFRLVVLNFFRKIFVSY